MPSIIKKLKKGKAYYYAVQSKRVNGKPRIVWQKYLGSVEAIIKMCKENLTPLPSEITLFEAGGVAALLSVATKLGLIDLINEIAPKRKQGPSVGHYIVLAALNRVLDPQSKSQIGDWYHSTVLQRLWNFSSETFTSQRFWDHMGMISEDAIDKIQNFVALRVKKEFKIDMQSLLYDSTNFFTYIDTHNDRNTIAQRGKNKQKRSDLRQVNLALITTSDFQIPLFHRAYDGNTPDIKFFPEVVQDLLGRHRALCGSFSDATLVFDKGNLSEEMMEKLLYSDTHFVAGLKAETLPEILNLPIDEFQDALKLPGTKYYETKAELSGKTCKIVIVYTESFFTQQLASLTQTMAKCQEKLKKLQSYLLSWTEEKKPKGKRPTKSSVEEKLKNILSAQHMKQVFTIAIKIHGKQPYMRYSVNRNELDRLTSTRLGRTLLVTNRQSLLPYEVISIYRNLVNVEEAFKHMKNRDYLRWQPQFHWTDQKIKVHTLCCVLALLLATLARKTAWEGGCELSLPTLLDELSAMKEVALLYTKNGKLKTQLTMNKMSPRQKKLAELFKIGEILAAG